MSGFSAAWLSLREPVDARSRSGALVEQLAQQLRARGVASLRALDLGTGLGSNPSYLAPRLAAAGIRQDWVLVDDSQELLRELPAHLRTRADIAALQSRGVLDFVTHQVDLARELPPLAAAGPVLATAAALFDLVCLEWLERFAAACAAARAFVLIALSYDGRATLEPTAARDAWMLQQFNLHQQRDKGFGPALGPEASRRTHEVLASRGYDVRVARSDWILSGADAELQLQLLDGWAAAVRELQPREAAAIAAWLASRRAAVMRGESRITIGHEDLLALPARAARRSQSNSTSSPST